jgi:hypothetical protein
LYVTASKYLKQAGPWLHLLLIVLHSLLYIYIYHCTF